VKRLVVAVGVFAGAAYGYADIRHELNPRANLGASFSLGAPATTTVSGGGSYHYAFHRHVQMGGAVSLGYESGTASKTTYTVLIGPTLNFGGEDLRDDYFLGVYSGVVSESEGPASGRVSLEAGKRFRILENVSLTPYALLAIPTDGSTMTLSLGPISFSVMF